MVPQIYVSELQTQVSNVLSDVSTWISHRISEKTYPTSFISFFSKPVMRPGFSFSAKGFSAIRPETSELPLSQARLSELPGSVDLSNCPHPPCFIPALSHSYLCVAPVTPSKVLQNAGWQKDFFDANVVLASRSPPTSLIPFLALRVKDTLCSLQPPCLLTRGAL